VTARMSRLFHTLLVLLLGAPAAGQGFGYSRDMSEPEPSAVPAGVELICLSSRGGAQ
jgi:hypothetical protein